MVTVFFATFAMRIHKKVYNYGAFRNCCYPKNHMITMYFATFAKSLASTGAFIASDKEVIDYLKQAFLKIQTHRLLIPLQ